MGFYKTHCEAKQNDYQFIDTTNHTTASAVADIYFLMPFRENYSENIEEFASYIENFILYEQF